MNRILKTQKLPGGMFFIKRCNQVLQTTYYIIVYEDYVKFRTGRKLKMRRKPKTSFSKE